MRSNLVALLVAIFMLSTAQAQTDDGITSNNLYACVSDNQAGLAWKGSAWVATQFKTPGKFILRVWRNKPQHDATAEFVHFEFNGDGFKKRCGTEYSSPDFLQSWLQCTMSGMTVLFDEHSGNGAISYLLGGIFDADAKGKRDSLSVMPFTCQPF